MRQIQFVVVTLRQVLPVIFMLPAYHPGQKTHMTMLKKFLRNESGATAIEYGLIASLIAVAAITAMTTVGTNLTGTFTNVSSKL